MRVLVKEEVAEPDTLVDFEVVSDDEPELEAVVECDTDCVEVAFCVALLDCVSDSELDALVVMELEPETEAVWLPDCDPETDDD